jgi:putative transcriptional regulator
MKTRLRVLRAEFEWSQAELARRVGVSRQTINAYEKERLIPSLAVAFRISRAFRKTIADVFLDEALSTAPDTTSERGALS